MSAPQAVLSEEPRNIAMPDIETGTVLQDARAGHADHVDERIVYSDPSVLAEPERGMLKDENTGSVFLRSLNRHQHPGTEVDA